jgi:hypothetical protein
MEEKKPKKVYTWTFTNGKQHTNVSPKNYGRHLQSNYNPHNPFYKLNHKYISHGLVKLNKNP